MVMQLLALALLIASATADGPRLSVPKTWMVRYPEEAFNLVCTGSKPLHWLAPHVPFDYFNVTHSEENGKFSSVYQIASPQAADTGHFKCLYPSGESASTYVYVYGNNETFVVGPGDLVISPEIGSNFTLDCRTTDPDINVTVFRNKKTNIWFDLEDITDEFYRDDYGAFRKMTQSLQDSGRYVCKGDRFESELQIYLTVKAAPSPLHAPSIKEFLNTYHVLGLPIILNCSVPSSETSIQLQWTLPNPSAEHTIDVMEVQQMPTYTVSTLRLPAASISDSGTYVCTARKGSQVKNATKDIIISESQESTVIIEDIPLILPIKEGENFRWIITVIVYPKNPRIIFYDPLGNILQNNERVSITFDYPTGQLCLKIQNVRPSDFGRYTVNVTTSDSVASNSTSVVMYVKAKPQIVFNVPKLHVVQEGSSVNMSTLIFSLESAHETPNVIWLLSTDCPDGITSCRGGVQITSVERQWDKPQNRWYSDVQFVPEKPGQLTCTVQNAYGSVKSSIDILITDTTGRTSSQLKTESGFLSVTSGSNVQVVEGDTIMARCSAVKYAYTSAQITSQQGTAYDCSTALSFASCIESDNIDSEFSTSYSCDVIDRVTSVTSSTNFEVYAIDKSSPILIPSRSSVSLDGTNQNVKIGQSLNISCVVDGQPKPNITWLKNGENIEEILNFLDNEAIVLESNKETINFRFIKRKFDGLYTCIAQNREGTIQPYTTVKVKGKSLGTAAIVFISLAAAVIVMLVLVVGCLVCRVKKERKFRNALRKNQLYLFEKGNVGDLNQDCMLDEQAELLPYDKSYEIDRERITIGKQLGCGAFGRVMLAELRATSSDLREGKVALKMGKDLTDQTHLRALTAELKIMIHLGKHLNIVNLIGANTARLDKGDMWILVEYCKYGNLLRFIQRHKKSFVNLIDPDTGAIDFTRTSPLHDPMTPGGKSYRSSSSGCDDRLSPSFQLVHPAMFRKAPQMRHDSQSSGRPGFYAGNPQYSQMGSLRSTSENSINMSPMESEPYDIPPSAQPKRHGSTSSERSAVSVDTGYIKNCNTDMTFLSGPPASQTEDTHGDFEVPGIHSQFSTSVLLCWAWQVACGMEYLAKRKVLHGDLAARNLLLAANNVVKISDFGLSKDIYKNDIYTKKDDGAMPIKWMSLEAIEQRLFSTQSDVWAYGVTLWELFTLGNTPYPGVAVDRDFVAQLEKGMRMNKPKYSNQQLYDLMLLCWEEDPTRRPTFQMITNVLSDLLYPEAKQQYVAMNDILIGHNKQWFETRPDYFNIVQTPDYSNLQPTLEAHYLEPPPAVPLYDVLPPTPHVIGYLPMHTIKNERSESNTTEETSKFFPDDSNTEPPKPPSTPSNNNSIKFNEFQEHDDLLMESPNAPPYVKVGLS